MTFFARTGRYIWRCFVRLYFLISCSVMSIALVVSAVYYEGFTCHTFSDQLPSTSRSPPNEHLQINRFESFSFSAFSEPEIQKPISNQNIESKRIGPVVMTIGDNITAFSGSTIKITCIASGIPKPLITWLKDGRAVIPGEKKIIDQKGSLTLRGVVSQDSGRYTCVAMNFAGRDTEDSFVTILSKKISLNCIFFSLSFCRLFLPHC